MIDPLLGSMGVEGKERKGVADYVRFVYNGFIVLSLFFFFFFSNGNFVFKYTSV